MEQTIAPASVERQLMSHEVETWPDWAGSWSPGAYAEKIAKEEEEWRLADVILCPSGFVLRGVAESGGPSQKCVVAPYGVSPERFPPRAHSAHAGPLRVLSVGGVGLRKGAPYVVGAAQRMAPSEAHFRWVGPGSPPARVLGDLPTNIEFLGPAPRDAVAEHYRWADLLLAPSVCEGSATVTYEALVSGLPVVCTPNAGSVVRHDVDGLIVETGSVDAIVAALRSILEAGGPAARFPQMGSSTRCEASLESYAGRLVAAVRGACERGARRTE